MAVTQTGVHHRQVSTIPLLGPNAPGHMGLMSQPGMPGWVPQDDQTYHLAIACLACPAIFASSVSQLTVLPLGQSVPAPVSQMTALPPCALPHSHVLTPVDTMIWLWNQVHLIGCTRKARTLLWPDAPKYTDLRP